MRALIVDDEQPNRKLLTHILQPYGACVEAVSGQSAVTLFKTALSEGNPFDLVLMDILMPEMDGQQALKEIRLAEKAAYGPSLSSLDQEGYAFILMITAIDDPAQLIQAYTKGKCNGYLNKPIAVSDLLDRLEKNNLITLK